MLLVTTKTHKAPLEITENAFIASAVFSLSDFGVQPAAHQNPVNALPIRPPKRLSQKEAFAAFINLSTVQYIV